MGIKFCVIIFHLGSKLEVKRLSFANKIRLNCKTINDIMFKGRHSMRLACKMPYFREIKYIAFDEV